MALREFQISDPPNFVKVIKDNMSEPGSQRKSIPEFKTIRDEVFLVAVVRGLNSDELTLLLNYFSKGSISFAKKLKLLPLLVPHSKVPNAAMKQFMAWFISNYRKKMTLKTSVCILQWIIGLLEYNLVDPNIIDGLYYDFFNMLEYETLTKYACKLLCKLTKPEDVSAYLATALLQQVTNHSKEPSYPCLLALLNVFRGYRPGLVSEEAFPKVDIKKTLNDVPQNMDNVMKLAIRRYGQQHVIQHPLGMPAENHELDFAPLEDLVKISSLVPLSTYSAEDVDKKLACHPNSIGEVFRKCFMVPIPQNVMSLLRDNKGFLLIMCRGKDLQKRFSVNLFLTLQKALIDKEETYSADDEEFLLSRVYQLQMFMQQGLPCVSIFLTGYLLNWDGLSHRSYILNLLEWVTFDSFTELSINILRPVCLLFVSGNVSMKVQIIQAVTNLIRNMLVADISRVRRGLPHPFLQRAPSWTNDPLSMLEKVVLAIERLIKVGLCQHPYDSILLMQCLHFYEVMSVVESNCGLPIWTVVSPEVVYHSLFNITPVALNRVCRLLLRYHKDFLPQLRLQQPHFYNRCSNKINLTSKYAQELINILWEGQALTRKEDGIMIKVFPENVLEEFHSKSYLDTAFDVAHNINFLPYIMHEEQQHGPNFLQRKEHFLALLEFYLEDIAEFIKYFSPPIIQDSEIDV